MHLPWVFLPNLFEKVAASDLCHKLRVERPSHRKQSNHDQSGKTVVSTSISFDPDCNRVEKSSPPHLHGGRWGYSPCLSAQGQKPAAGTRGRSGLARQGCVAESSERTWIDPGEVQIF